MSKITDGISSHCCQTKASGFRELQAHSYKPSSDTLEGTENGGDFLMWGESLHNNHHMHPGSANFASKWFEFDPIYPFIKVFDWMGIIRLRKMQVQPA